MKACCPKVLRLVATALLSTMSLSAWALITSPAWTVERYSFYEVVDNGGSYVETPGATKDAYGTFYGILKTTRSDLPFSDTREIAGTPGGSGFSSLSYLDGAYTAKIETIASSAVGSYVWSDSEANLLTRFTATSANLYVNYSLNGAMHLGVTGATSNTVSYASYDVVFKVSDVANPNATAKTFNWISNNQGYGLYEELYSNGSIDYDINIVGNNSDPLNFIFLAGHTYQLEVDVYSDVFISDGSNAHLPLTVAFSFSTTPVPEPSEAALLGLGLACLAGTLRLRRRR
jgi:hypothetical protein